MTEVFPNYYGEFQCIADRCEHNCCIGWEIDIDPDTLAFYDALDGDFGKAVRDGIDRSDYPHFKQDKNGRCALLRADGLCDIICNLGEEALCDICRDHPRFRNFLPERTETGLGLCCPEAARIILGQEEKFTVPLSSDDRFGLFRQKIFDILQDETVSLDKCIESVLEICAAETVKIDFSRLSKFLLSLERLDSEWENKLALLENDEHPTGQFDRPFRRLLCYFVFRHMSPDDLSLGISFAVLSFEIIKRIFAGESIRDFATLCDIARMYSSEIEYSDENLDALFSLCEDIYNLVC